MVLERKLTSETTTETIQRKKRIIYPKLLPEGTKPKVYRLMEEYYRTKNAKRKVC